MIKCNCKQNRRTCTCKGIELDYGKGERYLFLENNKTERRWEKIATAVLILMVFYFGYHIYQALTNDSVPF
jgi:hypothetical protein